MKIGLIGERHNFISYSMLKNSLNCADVEIVWFVDAGLPEEKREKLYGKSFDYGIIITILSRLNRLLKRFSIRPEFDCKALCDSQGITYIVPGNSSINFGLPEYMYKTKEADYVLIAGCDQLLNENGLKLAKNKIINYHYSPLPAYRGKNVVFWQWYNREPFIGYSFHVVDLGVDTGEVIYQGKIDYNPDELFSKVWERVVSLSSQQVCKVYECLKNNKKVLLTDKIESSYYPSKKYLELTIVDSLKTVDEVLTIFRKVGYLRLRNSLEIHKIISYGNQHIDKYEIDKQGIIIPLADGFIKGVFPYIAPIWTSLFLTGKKKLLKNLN